MNFTRAIAGLAVAFVLVLAGTSVAEHHDHDADIEQAVLNYANALYDMKPELIDESVSPKLQKVGYMPARDGSGLVEDWMTFQQLRDVAGHLNQDGMFDPETSPRDVTILHRTDTIATARLDAAWGVDSIHLSRHSGKWMIMNVIWEMPSE